MLQVDLFATKQKKKHFCFKVRYILDSIRNEADKLKHMITYTNSISVFTDSLTKIISNFT